MHPYHKKNDGGVRGASSSSKADTLESRALAAYVDRQKELSALHRGFDIDKKLAPAPMDNLEFFLGPRSADDAWDFGNIKVSPADKNFRAYTRMLNMRDEFGIKDDQTVVLSLELHYEQHFMEAQGGRKWTRRSIYQWLITSCSEEQRRKDVVRSSHKMLLHIQQTMCNQTDAFGTEYANLRGVIAFADIAGKFLKLINQ